MKTHIHDILSKELSRRDFLKLVGGSLILVMGVNSFIAYLANFNRPKIQSHNTPSTHGFGASKFGK